MSTRLRNAVLLTAAAVVVASAAGLAQSAIAQLGLTEAAARTFLFDELSAPTIHHRRSAIAIAGTRAFYKLPPAARGPAASALFAWAKAYVSSPAFTKAYADLRQGALPQGGQAETPTVDEELKKKMDEMLAALEEVKQAAAAMEPAARAKLLENLKVQEAQIRSPETVKMLRAALEAERGDRVASESRAVRSTTERLPADPKELFARRLREFLTETADADFSARTISLTAGADGIEFIEPSHRDRHWMWQLAVIAGREATTAARAAADTWLKEIAR